MIAALFVFALAVSPAAAGSHARWQGADVAVSQAAHAPRARRGDCLAGLKNVRFWHRGVKPGAIPDLLQIKAASA